jgi:gliding motility-associated lipoprotein GldD
MIIHWLSCSGNEYNPKPRMYPRIIYPEYKYQDFNTTFCPFTFQYPDYWSVEKDTSFFGEKPQHECWFNLQMETFNGTIHCSYYDITNKEDLTKYLKDAYRMAREHQIKANYIDEIPIQKPGKVSGILYNIEGPSASPFQFYLTDSLKHFFRASLYFNTQTRPDSLMPITEFVKKDIMTMLNSFEWK